MGEDPQLRFEDPATALVVEARALLAAAERKQSVPVARANAFARACLEMTEIGRLAMNVIDGGLFASARMIDLAASIVHGNSLLKVTTPASETVVSKKTP